MQKILKKSYSILFFLLFLAVVLRALWDMPMQSKGAAVVTVPLLIFLFCFLPGKLRAIPERVNCRKCWIVLQCLSVLAMLAEMYLMELQLSWDWQFLIRAAHEYVLEGGMTEESLRYFAVYPNNRFWLVCLIFLFKAVHTVFPFLSWLRYYKWISMLFAGFLTQTTIWLIYRTAREYFSEKRALLTGCLALFFLPFYLYAQHAYTDVPGMFCTGLILFLYTKIKKGEDAGRRNLLLVLLGIVTGIAYKIKVIVFILFIAILITELLTTRDILKSLRSLLILCVPMTLAVLGANFVTKQTVPVSSEMSDRYEFPPTHWIMMGLAKNGGYSAAEVAKTEKYKTYDQKVRANIRVIRKRLKRYGASGLLRHIVARKMHYTWCNSCLAGDYYGTKYPYRSTLLCEFLSINGRYHWITLIYTWPYYLLILLGILFSAAASLKKGREEPPVFDAGRLAILGLFLFLCIWECNSRYLVCLIPVFLLVSAQGLQEAASFVRRKVSERFISASRSGSCARRAFGSCTAV